MTDFVTSEEQLLGLYPEPSEAVYLKELDRLNEGCRDFIAASPFALLATSGESGVDCSPRGDAPGFVKVSGDGGEIFIPDRAGNNRLDSMKNILENPRVGVIFLVPGVDHTLRIRGTASISTNPELLETFAAEGKPPRTVTVVKVEKAFVQCSRALKRAGLWNPERLLEESEIPGVGEMLPESMKSVTKGSKSW